MKLEIGMLLMAKNCGGNGLPSRDPITEEKRSFVVKVIGVQTDTGYVGNNDRAATGLIRDWDCVVELLEDGLMTNGVIKVREGLCFKIWSLTAEARELTDREKLLFRNRKLSRKYNI